jgi:hypothetical protein
MELQRLALQLVLTNGMKITKNLTMSRLPILHAHIVDFLKESKILKVTTQHTYKN